ncbi:glutathione S-transferase family protein [Neisseria sp.]|uniref:glutathione S-transferase family protein n=1 Tax=Neisseria sp. TaxID=192066 RepID=UPI0035A15BCB
MFTLYSSPGTADARSLSPFAWKAEALLKLSGKPYQVEYPADFSDMPYGKVPVLKDGGKLIPDSSLIQQYLEQHYGLDVDGHLTAEQKAIAQAFRRMTEEHLYWTNVYARWLTAEGKSFLMKNVFAALPEEVREPAFAQIAEKSRRQLDMHGIGKHPQEQIYAFGCADIEAISTYLGGKDFFFGDKISSLDCAVAPVVAGFLDNDFATPMSDLIRSMPNLSAYVERFDKAVFGG